MAVKFSKIDKLLQLFNSSDDDQEDELNYDNEIENDKNNKYNDLSDLDKNETYFKDARKTKKVKRVSKRTRKRSTKRLSAVADEKKNIFEVEEKSIELVDSDACNESSAFSENERFETSKGKKRQRNSAKSKSKELSELLDKEITNEINVVKIEVTPIVIKDSDDEFGITNKKTEDNTKCSDNNSNWSGDNKIESKKMKKIRRKRKTKSKVKGNTSYSEEDDDLDFKDNYKPLPTRKNRPRVDRNLKCKECDQRMKNEQLFILHMQIHSDRKETECDICNKDFDNVNFVMEHYASFDKNKEDPHYIKMRPFSCHLCHSRYKNRRNLTDHLDHTHAGERKYLCPICGKQFSKKFNMKTHIKVHEKFHHSCEPCNKKFRNIREYETHQRMVHGENNLTCPICNRAFSRRDNMKTHLETHNRVNYECILCNTSFKLQRVFIRHMREVHNHSKKYPCPTCGKIFLLHCKLTQHQKAHNRIKDKCSICDKEFRNRRDYNAHMRNMHGMIIDLSKKKPKKQNQQNTTR